MAVLRIQENIKKSDGTYDTVHKETEAGLVLFNDNETFQQKYETGELNGQRGTRWKTGTAITGTSTIAKVFSESGIADALPGDMYLNTSYSYVYECVTGGVASVATWKYLCSIKGSTGARGVAGATGARGSQWLTGTLLSGTSSTTGAYSRASIPASLVGDMYLNTSYGYIYQCTTAGTGSAAKWTYKGSIKGATGNPGTTTWDGITDKPSVFTPASHTHAASDVASGTLPVDRGGTGATTAAQALTNLGAAAASHGTHVSFSSTAPGMDGTASAGSASTVARSDHRHPTDTSRAPATHNHTASAISAGTFTATEVKAMSGTDYSTARVRNICAGTADLTAGSSTLTSGDIYLVYE